MNDMTTDHLTASLPLTLFRMSGSKRAGTLLFFPDIGGNTIYARPLVQDLGHNVLCLGVRFAPDMIEALAELSLEDIGSRFAKDILEIQLPGPVCLLGFSFAASLAYETGRAMTKLGVAPDRIWILDMPAPVKLNIRSILKEPKFHLKSCYRYARSNWRRIALGKYDPLILHRYGGMGMDLRGHPESYRYIIGHLYGAFGRYEAKPSANSLTIFRAQNGRPERNSAPDLGWGSIATGQVKSVAVPGDHLSMLRKPEYASVIAGHIASELKLFVTENIDETNG